MKKILFLCDANNFPSGAFQFIKSLHQTEPFLLTGAFFHSVNYDVILPASLSLKADPLLAFTDADSKAVAGSIEQFTEKCLKSNIEYRVHEESEHYEISDLVKESRFADLIVLSEELYFAHLDKNQPNKYMQQVLHRSECPLLLIPESYVPFSRILVGYDGKKQSMFALKQFIYLFTEYTKLPVTITYVEEDSQQEIPDLHYLEEYAAKHFGSLDIQKTDFINKDYFSAWVGKKKDTLLITGSYSHAGLLTALRESFIEKVIHQHNIPIFIAHNA